MFSGADHDVIKGYRRCARKEELGEEYGIMKHLRRNIRQAMERWEQLKEKSDGLEK